MRVSFVWNIVCEQSDVEGVIAVVKGREDGLTVERLRDEGSVGGFVCEVDGLAPEENPSGFYAGHLLISRVMYLLNAHFRLRPGVWIDGHSWYQYAAFQEMRIRELEKAATKTVEALRSTKGKIFISHGVVASIRAKLERVRNLPLIKPRIGWVSPKDKG